MRKIAVFVLLGIVCAWSTITHGKTTSAWSFEDLRGNFCSTSIHAELLGIAWIAQKRHLAMPIEVGERVLEQCHWFSSIILMQRGVVKEFTVADMVIVRIYRFTDENDVDWFSFTVNSLQRASAPSRHAGTGHISSS